MRIKRARKTKNWRQKLLFWRKPKATFPWKWWLAGGVVGGTLLLGVYTFLILPDVRGADQLSFAESTFIYASGALEPGEDPLDHLLYTIHGDENREYIPLEEISPWVKQATLAIEDDQFYSHFGFDIGGIAKAVLNHFLKIGNARGGSTITQQLVKNTFLNNDRSLIRKFNELLLSVKLEMTYSKDEILELYLNKIPYGNNAYGIEAAAKTYFNKSARELTIAEAAILASLPVAPSRFNPFGSNRDLLMGFYDMETSFRTEEEARAAEEETDEDKVRVYKKGRKDLVLQRMLDLNMITQAQFQQAWGEGLTIEFKTARSDIKAPHFVFYVRERVEEKYGKEFLNQGGLRIYTTLDMDLQREAEAIVADKTDHYEETYGAKNVALTAIENGSGKILAYIGGKDFFDEKNDGQVDVLTSRRQPGSSFKPFVYAAGFETGYAPGTVVFDVETDFGDNYKPQNFDEKFSGPVSLRRALNASMNIPAIKIAALATPAKVLSLVETIGVKYEGDADMHGVAIGVGVAEVEPLSHINAFQAFAGDGSWYSPTAILEIRNADDKLLEKIDIESRKNEGLDTEIAALVRHILTDQKSRPVTDGFAWNKLLQLDDIDNGAKTGTSNRVAKNPAFNESRPESDSNQQFLTVPGDSWTVGFTPHLITGVWVGNNRGEPMRSGATGLTVAAPVWKTFTESAHELLALDPEQEYVELDPPLKKFNINKFSGRIATKETPSEIIVTEVYANSNLPTRYDGSIVEKEIDLMTGRPATEETPELFREKRKVLSLRSIRPDWPSWNGPVMSWIYNHPKFVNSLGLDFGFGWDAPDPEDLIDPEEAKDIRQESLRERLLRLRRKQNGELGPGPEVQIFTPRNGTSITPGTVEILISANAQSGMRSVEFYFDDKLVDETVRPPYTGSFNLPNRFEIGSVHTIKAVAVDQDYQSATTEIEVTIDEDREGPSILFVAPVANKEIPTGSLYEVQVEVKDNASSIRSVQLQVDDQIVGTFNRAPYRAQVVAEGDLGRRFVKATATDANGNITTKSIPVMYGRPTVSSFAPRSTETQTAPTPGSLTDINPWLKPKIERILNNRNSLSVQLFFPDPQALSGARVIVSKGGKQMHAVYLEEISKTASVNLSRSIASGSALVELQAKDGTRWDTIDSQTVNF